MSRWTHSICDVCWATHRKGGFEPVRVRKPEEEACCYCGQKHHSGIYFRENPKLVSCKGEGGAHKC